MKKNEGQEELSYRYSILISVDNPCDFNQMPKNRLVVLGLAFSRSFKGISGSFAVTDFRTEVF